MSSKRQQILDAATTALLNIKKSAGYNNDIQVVFRGLRYIEDIGNDKFPCLCFSGIKETRKNINKTQFQAVVSLALVGYVSSEGATDSLQDTLDGFIEDVTKALETDRQFGALTLWNEIQSIMTDRGDNEKVGAFVMDVVFNYAAPGIVP